MSTDLRTLRHRLQNGTLPIQSFLRAVRRHSKQKKQKENKTALYGCLADVQCQVGKKEATSYFLHHWKNTQTTTPNQAPASLLEDTDFDNSPIRPDEVSFFLAKSCASSSSPGRDKVSFQDLRDMESTAAAAATESPLRQRFQQAKDSGKPETSWGKAVVTLVYKKGVTTNPASYRPISVLPAAARIFHKILAARLHRCMANKISPNQKGFRPGIHGTVEHVLSLRQEIANTPSGQPIYVLLLDLRQAYDTVFHTYMWRRLQHLQLPGWFLQYLQNLYNNADATICCKDGKTTPIPVRRGLLQGCPLSPVLWNLLFDPAIEQHRYPPNLAIRAFADDVAMSSTSLPTIRAAIQIFEAAIQPMGVATNPSKCVVCKLVDGKPTPMEETIHIAGNNCPTADTFSRPPKYLGVPLWNFDGIVLERFRSCLQNLAAADLPSGRKANILQQRFLPDHFFLLQHAFLLEESTLQQLDHLVSSSYTGWRKWAPPAILPSRLLCWLQSMVFYRLLARNTTSLLAFAAVPISTRLGHIVLLASILRLFPATQARTMSKRLLLFDDDINEPPNDYPHFDFSEIF